MKAALKTVPLGEVVEVIGGGTPSKRNPAFYGGNIPWATVRDMNVEHISKTEHAITPAGLKASSSKLIPAGEVVIATRVGLGKACILGQDTAINQDLRGLVPKSSKQIDRRFLFHWFKSIANQIIEAGTGATVQGVKLPFIKALAFPLLPLEEQQRIVAVLDAAFEGLDRVRVHAEANLQNARDLFERELHAAIEALADQYGTTQLGSVRNFRNGFAFKSLLFKPRGEPVVRISNIQDGEVDEAKMVYTDPSDYSEDLTRYQVQPDDLLIAMSGATTGKVGFNTTGKVLLQNQRVGRFCPTDKLDLRFLYFFLDTKVAEHLSISAGAAQPNLSTKQITEIEIPIPPRGVQEAFVHKIELLKDATRSIKGNYTESLRDLNGLRQSLLQKAFAGKLT